ncbi:hypothetical protein FDA94_29135 [Herbidospora galbida]|uniref:Uncharacterized protein n=1 Tax=Herbidospora galbida TaxID=2575442 RepID=A0A4U3M805_9ACTN|nr:hypothetical protein [Herbidospora galbida]TKK84680.1 hypothetical protein FDA94_29135 [Herbidospora galbida]
MNDLLEDWLRVNTDNPADAWVYLPAADDWVTKAVLYTADLLVDLGSEGPGYSVVTDHTTQSRKVKQLIAGAKEGITSDKAGMTDNLIALLQEDQETYGRTPYVILAFGADDEAPDDNTEDLLLAAQEAGITILELAALGLDELVFDLEDAPEEEINVAEEITKEARDAALAEAMDRHPAGKAVQQTLPDMPAEPVADEAQALPAAVITTREPDEIPKLAEVLRLAHDHFLHTDIANASAHGQPTRLRPLTHWLGHYRDVVDLRDIAQEWREKVTPEPEPEQLTIESASAETEPPKPVGRTRAKAGEVSVLVNELGEIVKLAGKGKPGRGLTRKIVPKEQAEHLLAS